MLAYVLTGKPARNTVSATAEEIFPESDPEEAPQVFPETDDECSAEVFSTSGSLIYDSLLQKYNYNIWTP